MGFFMCQAQSREHLLISSYERLCSSRPYIRLSWFKMYWVNSKLLIIVVKLKGTPYIFQVIFIQNSFTIAHNIFRLITAIVPHYIQLKAYIKIVFYSYSICRLQIVVHGNYYKWWTNSLRENITIHLKQSYYKLFILLG